MEKRQSEEQYKQKGLAPPRRQPDFRGLKPRGYHRVVAPRRGCVAHLGNLSRKLSGLLTGWVVAWRRRSRSDSPYPMEGLWIQKVNKQGQIYDLTVMLRPYPAVTVLRNTVKGLAEKSGVLGNEYFELPKSD